MYSKEKLLTYQKKYYSKEENKIRRNAKTKEWVKKFPQRAKEIRKKWYLKNRPKILKDVLNWKKEHRERVREQSRARSAKKRNRTYLPRKESFRLRFEVFLRDNFTCQYCGRNPKEDPIKLEIDHIIPRSKDGENKKENLITACYDCNIGKSNLII